jgi:hypothetical protein
VHHFVHFGQGFRMVLWDKLEKLSAKTIHVRLFVLMLLLLAGSFSIMGVQQGFILTSAIESDALEKAKSDLMTGMACCSI